MDKVYQQLLEIIREEGKYYNDEQLSMATVASISPLQVTYGGMSFSGGDLRVSEHLLEKTIPVELLDDNEQIPNIEIKCSEGTKTDSLDVVKKIKIPSVLKIDDLVVVILRGDVLWVLCKVV
jgi:hypothetical protein